MKTTRSKFVLILCLSLLLLVMGAWTVITTREHDSSVSNDEPGFRSRETLPFAKADELLKVVFLTSKTGYAATFDKIYKTTDGGDSWAIVGSIPDHGMKDLALISDREAFVLTYPLGEKLGGQVMMTNDGGLTWNTLFSSKSEIPERLYFDSHGKGAVVGRKKDVTREGPLTNFVVLTNDSGRSWTDASDAQNSISKSSEGESESLTNVQFTKDGGVVVLSSAGRLYKSSNEGTSWIQIGGVPNERPQTDIRHFGQLENGEFWIGGGTISREGTWGIVARKSFGGWNKFRLNGYYFADITFLTRETVIACGSTVAAASDGGRGIKRGVILSSPNGGRTWSVVHESGSSVEFTSIAKISEKKLFVVGEGGAAVLLETLGEK